MVAGGSSPHTRGALRLENRPAGRDRIIPAYAGSTPTPSGTTQKAMDHPRIRGEHIGVVAAATEVVGSSPHTRGAPAGAGDDRPRRGIIPAYAGSTPTKPRPLDFPRDHPRIRGEHDLVHTDGILKPGSSPHTRGAPYKLMKLDFSRGIIPAYAGSTRRSGISSCSPRDHPRIRGEHTERGRHLRGFLGSSPHTRGAPHSIPTERGRHRIIPAYAGSTLGNPCNTKDRRRDYTSFPLPVTHPSGGGGS